MPTLVGSASNQSSGSTTTLTLSRPAVLAGDIMLVIVMSYSDSVVDTPAGWTVLDNIGSGTRNYSLIYSRTATSSEPTSYSWTNVSNYHAGVMIVYRDVGSVLRSTMKWVAGSSITTNSVSSTTAGTLLTFGSTMLDSANTPNLTINFGTKHVQAATTWPAAAAFSESYNGSGTTPSRTISCNYVGTLVSVAILLTTNNTAPNTPTDLQRTGLLTDNTPNFSCNVSDPDSGDQIKGRFTIQTSAGAAVGSVDSAFRTGNGAVSAEYASALAAGKYRVNAVAIDAAGVTSAATAWVGFDIRQNVSPIDRVLRWNTRQADIKQLALQWNVSQANLKELGLVWHYFQGAGPKDLNLQWYLSTVWTKVPENVITWTERNT